MTIEMHARWNIGDAEMFACHIGPVAKLGIEQLEDALGTLLEILDLVPIALVLGRAPIGPERADQLRLERRRGPVHPLIDWSALARIARPPRLAAVARGE